MLTHASLPTSGRQRPIRIIRPRQLGVQFLASCQSNGAECQDTLCFKGLFCLVRDPSRRFTDRVGSSREDGPGGVINMLIFYCNHCNEMLTGGDYESTDQIVDRLDEHIKKCPPAAFTFEGTTGVATQRLDALRSFHEGERRAGKIRLH